MYARRVSLQLKPNTSTEFSRKLESDVIPLLRKQKGFQDEIAFTAKGGKEAFGISLWDRKESAEAYEKSTYPQVAKLLEKVVEGPARVETFEVSNSTFHKIVAAAMT
jgi:heme-degrading monooxygenase HmoA